MQKHALDSLELHNQVYQNTELLENMFCFLLVFQYPCEVNQYVGRPFLLPHHPIEELILKHHGPLDVVGQNLNLVF